MVNVATERFLERLSANGYKVREMYGRYRAQCPAHNGEDLNLSIADGDQGVLVKCWSQGCHEADIAGAVGLDVADLFDEKGRAEYDYGNGHRVLRTRTGTGKKITQVKAPERTALWVHPESKPIAHSPRVVLVEGEKSVDAMIRLGASCVTTWPGGSSAIGKVDLSPLKGKAVTIIPDNDEPGEKALRGLVGLLQGIAAQVDVWRVPAEYEGVALNDAADLWQIGGTKDALVRAVTPEPEAPPEDPNFLQHVNDLLYQKRVRERAEQEWAKERGKQVTSNLVLSTLGEIQSMDYTEDWLVPNLLEKQDRLILTGFEGGGKSTLLRQLVIAMAAGAHPFNMTEVIDPIKALVIDAENTPRQWARGTKYMTDIALDVGQVDPRENVVLSAGIRLDLTKQADVNQIHALLDKYGPEVLYIGPLYKLVPKEIKTDDDAAPLLAALDSIRERGVTLLMEAHAGKGNDGDGNRDLRPRGSSALLGWPEYGYGIRQSRDEFDMNGRPLYDLSRWRGDREEREWPEKLRRGVGREWLWMDAAWEWR